MLRNLTKKQKGLVVLAVIAVIAAAALAVGAYMRTAGFTAGRGQGSATGNSAVMDMQAAYGDSRLVSMADLTQLPEGEDPLTYLVDNSSFALDEDYITKQAEVSYLGSEATAQAAGMTYDQYVSAQYGESVEDYEKAVYETHEQFLKERLAAYEYAKENHITITVAEYEELLPYYANKYGYQDTQKFEQECEKDSIATEMLYDKAVTQLLSQY